MRRDLIFYGGGLLSLSWLLALWAPSPSISQQAQVKPQLPPPPALLAPSPISPALCSKWDFRLNEGVNLSPLLEEMSGLAWSRHWADTLYHITDSGNNPDLLITNARGQLQGKIRFGDRNSDVEDIASGPCPWSGSCLYIADTGDNLRLRSDHQIHIIEEARLFDGIPRRQTLHFKYEGNERFDVEALAVHPRSGNIHLFTKQKGKSQVFELRQPFGEGALIAQPLGRLPFGKITGAAHHPSGERLLLINWQGAVELSQSPLEGFQKEARDWYPYQRFIKLQTLDQQEAITYALDGLSFYYSSEKQRWSKKDWGLVEARCTEEQTTQQKK